MEPIQPADRDDDVNHADDDGGGSDDGDDEEGEEGNDSGDDPILFARIKECTGGGNLGEFSLNSPEDSLHQRRKCKS